jgi:hypothetical protein
MFYVCTLLILWVLGSWGALAGQATHLAVLSDTLGLPLIPHIVTVCVGVILLLAATVLAQGPNQQDLWPAPVIPATRILSHAVLTG